MKKQYFEPQLELYLETEQRFIMASGDNFEDDPWSNGVGYY